MIFYKFPRQNNSGQTVIPKVNFRAFLVTTSTIYSHLCNNKSISWHYNRVFQAKNDLNLTLTKWFLWLAALSQHNWSYWSKETLSWNSKLFYYGPVKWGVVLLYLSVPEKSFYATQPSRNKCWFLPTIVSVASLLPLSFKCNENRLNQT